MAGTSNRRLTTAKAMSEAIAQAMQRDARVLVMGEDIGALGGVFGTTQGLLEKFGPERVRDTPISETGFIGAAVGLAAAGYRPVVELMFVDFFGVCMDAIYNLAAKQHYFSVTPPGAAATEGGVPTVGGAVSRPERLRLPSLHFLRCRGKSARLGNRQRSASFESRHYYRRRYRWCRSSPGRRC